MGRTYRRKCYNFLIHGPGYEKITHRNDLHSSRKRRRGMNMSHLMRTETANMFDRVRLYVDSTAF